ncbi:hypothetical protein QUF64_02165 [Anaerolineales bacterium HSG6]|nr:hypothetical protein [Anaerolineales bacterium HSG6]
MKPVIFRLQNLVGKTIVRIQLEEHEWDRAIEGYIRIYYGKQQIPYVIYPCGFSQFAKQIQTEQISVACYQQDTLLLAIYKDTVKSRYWFGLWQGKDPTLPQTWHQASFFDFFSITVEIDLPMLNRLIQFLQRVDHIITPPWYST